MPHPYSLKQNTGLLSICLHHLLFGFDTVRELMRWSQLEKFLHFLQKWGNRLIFSGYQYRILRINSKLSWVFVKGKCGKRKWKLSTTLQYERLSKMDHRFFKI